MTVNISSSQYLSLFPDYPRGQPAINKDGNFTPIWQLGMSQLFQTLRSNYKNEGIMFPPLTPANQATIQALYTPFVGGTYNALTAVLPDISGQTVYDPINNVTQQFVIGKDTASPPTVTFAEWVPLSVMLTNAGNPNTHVAGALNWLCYDTMGMTLYICTAAGSASAATWQAL